MMRHKKKSTLKCFLGSRSPSWVKTGEEGNHFFCVFWVADVSCSSFSSILCFFEMGLCVYLQRSE